jgi:short-subunit dehydrogenase
MSKNSTVLITGASSGIGAVYADRFARRGHDLVLVARDAARLEAIAGRLRAETGVSVEVLPADLTEPAGLARVEVRARDDGRIGVLVNNAGASARGDFLDQSGDDVGKLLALNVTALTRLANAVAPIGRSSGAKPRTPCPVHRRRRHAGPNASPCTVGIACHA